MSSKRWLRFAAASLLVSGLGCAPPATGSDAGTGIPQDSGPGDAGGWDGGGAPDGEGFFPNQCEIAGGHCVGPPFMGTGGPWIYSCNGTVVLNEPWTYCASAAGWEGDCCFPDTDGGPDECADAGGQCVVGGCLSGTAVMASGPACAVHNGQCCLPVPDAG
jgi:hypothetical protein